MANNRLLIPPLMGLPELLPETYGILPMARTYPPSPIYAISHHCHVDAGKTTTTERILYYRA